MGLARGSYFYHRARIQTADKYAEVRLAIADILKLNHRCYEYRRVRAALGRQKVFISEKVVRRLMKQEDLSAATTRRRRYGSYELVNTMLDAAIEAMGSSNSRPVIHSEIVDPEFRAMRKEPDYGKYSGPS